MFVFKSKVYFGDTDAAQVVYHGRYIYWLEAARIEMLLELGMPYSQFQAQKIGLIPIDIHMQYHKPLKFEDSFTIETHVIEVTSASFTLKSFVKNSQNESACTGVVKLACIDETTWKPRRLPEKLKAGIQTAPYLNT